MLSETRMDKMDRENSCESMQLFAPKTQQFNLIFFWLPRTGTGARPRPCWITTLGRALQWDSLATSPITDIIPSPDQVPPALFRQAWSSGSATSAVINGAGPDGCLPELDMFPLLKVVFMVYVLLC